ncbi:hypothetical protein LP7551_03410 [Roseibium album]|nr:hypothetical protein LP7551_03410 [Roseibium album]
MLLAENETLFWQAVQFEIVEYHSTVGFNDRFSDEETTALIASADFLFPARNLG